MGRPTDEQIASWYPRLFRTALRMTGSSQDAADLTQEAFCKALGRWDEFGGHSLPTTWLHRILVNCATDWARRRATRSNMSLVEEWALAAVESCDHQPSEALARRAELDSLRQAIKNLPEKLRSAFIATVLDGYTYEEAAELLAVPVGTVASRVHEGRKFIHREMRKSFVEI